MTIEERMDRLERQNRWLKGGLGLVLVAAFSAALLGFTQPQRVPDVVRAKAFHVVTDDGTVLVKLEDTHGMGIGIAGTVTTLSGDGQDLVRLSALPGKEGHAGPGKVETINTHGQVVTELGATVVEDGAIATSNAHGKHLVQLRTTELRTGMVVTLDADGHHMVELTASKRRRSGALRTLAPDGRHLVLIGDLPNGAGHVTTLQPDGQHEAAQLGSFADGGGFVKTFDQLGKTLALIGLSNEGTGAVVAMDPAGKKDPVIFKPE